MDTDNIIREMYACFYRGDNNEVSGYLQVLESRDLNPEQKSEYYFHKTFQTLMVNSKIGPAEQLLDAWYHHLTKFSLHKTMYDSRYWTMRHFFFSEQNKLEDAIEAIKHRITIASKLDDFNEMALGYYNAVKLLLDKGDLNTCQVFLDQALDLRNKISGQILGMICAASALFHILRGNTDLSLKYLKESIDRSIDRSLLFDW